MLNNLKRFLVYLLPIGIFIWLLQSIHRNVYKVKKLGSPHEKFYYMTNVFGGLYLAYNEELEIAIRKQKAEERERKSESKVKKVLNEYWKHNKDISSEDKQELISKIANNLSTSEIKNVYEDLKDVYDDKTEQYMLD